MFPSSTLSGGDESSIEPVFGGITFPETSDIKTQLSIYRKLRFLKKLWKLTSLLAFEFGHPSIIH